MSEQPVITTARQLTDALNGMAQRLEDVNRDSEARDDALAKATKVIERYARRTRWAVIFDIAMTLVIAFFGWLAHNASDQAAANRNATVVACEQTNTARAENVQLWDYLIGLSGPGPHATAAEKAEEAKLLGELKNKVAVTFAPRNCQALVNGHGKS